MENSKYYLYVLPSRNKLEQTATVLKLYYVINKFNKSNFLLSVHISNYTYTVNV